MTNEYKPDPQAVVEFMCDAICRDNQVTGKIDFIEGFVTIEEDGKVWKSKPFSREYENGMRVEYLKSVFKVLQVKIEDAQITEADIGVAIVKPATLSFHESDTSLLQTMAEIAGMSKNGKPN